MRVNTRTGRLTESKARLLEEAGYAYSFDREIYVNRKTKKLFSLEFVADNSEDKIQERIRRREDGTRWHFYCNEEPSNAVRRELELVLG
jgi:hypothetical protein